MRYPHPSNEDAFEEFVVHLLRVLWNSQHVERFGRRGQRQYGVDILDRGGSQHLRAAQCKLHSSNSTLRPSELRDEVKKAERFPQRIGSYYFLTTSQRSTDTDLELISINSNHRAQGLFTVELLTWEAIERIVDDHSDLQARLLPESSLAVTRDTHRTNEAVRIAVARLEELISVATPKVSLGAQTTYAGFYTARPSEVLGSSEWNDVAATAITSAKLLKDLTNSCLSSLSDGQGALEHMASAFHASAVCDKAKFPGSPFLKDIDYSNQGGLRTHLSRLTSAQAVLRVNCSPLFPAALATLLSLKAKFGAHGISLNIQAGDLTSKAQVRSLSRNHEVDFAVLADPAFFLSSSELDTRRRFSLVIPCFAQEDCLLSLDSPGTSRGPRQIYFHEASTAEVMLRVGPFWPRRNLCSPIVEATSIPSLITSLQPNQYMTTWEPMTSVMLANHGNLRVVPGSGYRSFVSLYAENSWLRKVRRPALLSFVKLFMGEWVGLRRSSALKLLAEHDVIHSVGTLSGYTSLVDGFGTQRL